MIKIVLDTISWILLTAGAFFVLVGGIGALRMPNLYTRMHAASVTDTMGAVLVLCGVMVQAGLSLATIKLAAILLFLLITSPTSSYALAHAALLAGIKPAAGHAADEEHHA
ncbi:MAG: monovalent cation/H(+) antiporter subunit G [Xanthomonadales bacterium]|nr:monovalent cation/H(+) antiporter subunit G [Gammaproteobacteria bacterium]MBT8054427.1 monovalent cation/H(+) antiporter subunit G [Gammaproteobacteria bacterium]NND58441.1 monovalent cation/H(+) antiporter subunit G [Xanthomonadales bacterium]NNK50138.1 monovalent cation/H(+) antiporter subunit G [Xanthomonadales bacterium]NNL95185.1 monovalent cation/H(+) antiporter subunit G [Xanthomonadales bacterium]